MTTRTARTLASTAAPVCAAFLPFVPLAALSPAQTWTELGPAPITGVEYTGRIAAIACSATDPDRYFVGGADAGVWRTTDGGATWTPLTGHLPTTAIGALAIDPSDESTVYAGSGEANFANHSRYGLGLYKSTDGGDTWSVLAHDTFAGRCFSKIVVNPQNPQTLYASITRAGGFPEMAAAKSHPQRAGPLGVFRSDDGGHTWTHLSTPERGLPDLSATDLAIDPQNPDTLYTAIGHIFGSPDNGIYKTTNAGATWARLTAGLPADTVGRISLAVAPSAPDRLYALITNPATPSGGGASNRNGYRSDNAGATWTGIGGVEQATYGWYLSVAAVPPGAPNTVFFGGLQLRRRTIGAPSANVTPPHVDLHAVTWDAAGRLVAGCDGGVYRSTNNGGSWTPLNTGLGAVQFYAGLSTHPADESVLIGGTQDNGTNRRTPPDARWRHVFGGDGGWTQINQSNPLIAFAESQGTANLFRSVNGGFNFVFSGEGIDGGDRNCFLPPYLIDPANPQRMLYATHRVYQSTNGGFNWVPISDDLSNGSGAIRALAIAPSDSSAVYAATNDGNVLVSTDGGARFEVILVNNPGWPRVTREIAVHPTDPLTMYLAVAAFGTDRVLRTRDAGKTWEPLDGDLPDRPVNVVAVDASRNSAAPTLYAGTDAGIYRSTDDGATWTRWGCGFPNAAVIDLRLDLPRARLVAATQGRGAWTAPLRAPADWNDSGAVNSDDFFAFLASFFNADADFNDDGVTDSDDYFAFLSAFFEGC